MSTNETYEEVVLENAAQAFADAHDHPPYLHRIPVEEGRRIVDAVLEAPFPLVDARTDDLEIDGGPTGRVGIRQH